MSFLLRLWRLVSFTSRGHHWFPYPRNQVFFLFSAFNLYVPRFFLDLGPIPLPTHHCLRVIWVPLFLFPPLLCMPPLGGDQSFLTWHLQHRQHPPPHHTLWLTFPPPKPKNQPKKKFCCRLPSCWPFPHPPENVPSAKIFSCSDHIESVLGPRCSTPPTFLSLSTPRGYKNSWVSPMGQTAPPRVPQPPNPRSSAHPPTKGPSFLSKPLGEFCLGTNTMPFVYFASSSSFPLVVLPLWGGVTNPCQLVRGPVIEPPLTPQQFFTLPPRLYVLRFLEIGNLHFFLVTVYLILFPIPSVFSFLAFPDPLVFVSSVLRDCCPSPSVHLLS